MNFNKKIEKAVIIRKSNILSFKFEMINKKRLIKT